MGPGRQPLRFAIPALAAAVGAGLMLYVQAATAPSARPPVDATAGSHYVQGQVLVKFRPPAGALARRAAVAARGHRVLAELGQPGWVQVRLAAGETVETAQASYRSDPSVEYVQPNYIYHALAVPDDPQYGQLWAFRNTGQAVAGGDFTPDAGTAGADMDIEPAWDHITDCSGAVVAVLDTGVNYNHEDLAGNMWDGGPGFPKHGWNYVDNNADPMDLEGHGSHVAGIIGAAGNNGRGTAGVCWKATLMAVRVLDAQGAGDTSGIIQGIDFAVSNHAKVINMSLGGGGAFDQAFSDSISNAQDNDVVVVAAAGNSTFSNDDYPFYPCNFTQPNMVCVAALDQNYALASFSNWGAGSVAVGAPGTNILSSFAGTRASLADPLTAWTISGGWTHTSFPDGDLLTDPAGFPNVRYGPGLMDTAIKGFDTSAADVIFLNDYYVADLADSEDRFIVGVDANGVDAFGENALQETTAGPVHSTIYPAALDISRCARHVNCLIGFKLATGAATPGDLGVSVAFSIDALTLTTDAHAVLSGTSMAAPEVAGLATMLRAYNPQFTFADTVSAIENAGRPVPALSGKTRTGDAIDAMSSLAYINPPTGLTVTVR